MRRQPAGADALAATIDELRRQDRVELLKRPLEDYGILSPESAMENGAVSVEALKKLVRRWKLHERREFWKHHNTKEQLVDVLIEHMKTHPTYEQLEFDPVDSLRPRAPRSPPRSTKAARPGRTVTMMTTTRPQFSTSSSTPFLAKVRYDRNSLNVACVMDFLAEWNDMSVRQRTVSAAEKAKLNVSSPEATIKRRKVAQQLMEFSFSSQGLEAVLQGESLPRVIEMFNTSDEEICNACAVAISNVVSNSAIRLQLYEAGLLDVLARVHQYCTGVMGMRACALILYHLSCDLYEERIFSTMAHFLHGCISDQGELELQDITVLTLQNLLPCLERHSVVESMFVCLRLMVQRPQASVEMMATLLRNITSYASVHFSVIEHGVIELLAGVLSLQPTNVEVLNSVAQAVANLMSSADVFPALLSRPLIPLLRKITDVRESESSRLVALSVGQFTVHADTATIISQFNGVELLKSLTHSNLPPVTRAAVAAALANLTVSSDELKHLAVIQQLHELLTELLLSADGTATVEFAALTGLCNLAPNAKLDQQLNQRLSSHLSVYLATDRPLDTRLIAARVLYNIVRREQSKDHLLTDSILQQLMVALNGEAPQLTIVGLQVLTLFCRTEISVEKVFNDGFMELLLRHTSAESAVREQLSILFAQLLNLAGPLLDIHFNKVLQVASNLAAGSPSSVVFHHCSRAVCALSVHSSHFGSLYPLAKPLISSNQQPSLALISAITLYNFCCMSEPETEELRTDKDMLAEMVNLMRTGDAATQGMIAKAFCMLSLSPTFVETMLKQKVLESYIVTAILRTNEAAVKLLCARTLYNMLALESYRPDLVEADVFWAIIKLSRDSDVELQAIGSRVVLHFTSEPSLLAVLRKHNVFGSLLAMVGEDVNTCELVLDATTNLLAASLSASELASCCQILGALALSPAENKLLDQIVEALGFVFQQLFTEPEQLIQCVKESFLELISPVLSKEHLPHTRFLLAAIMTNACRAPNVFSVLPVTDFLNALGAVCGTPQELPAECVEQIVYIMAKLVSVGGEWTITLPTTKFAWKVLRHAAQLFPPEHPVLDHCLRITAQLLQAEQVTGLRRHAACFELLSKQTARSIVGEEQLYLIGSLSTEPDLALEVLQSTPVLSLLGECLSQDFYDEGPLRLVAKILRNLTAFEECCTLVAAESTIPQVLGCLREYIGSEAMEDLVMITYHLAYAVNTGGASVELTANFVLSFMTELKNLVQERHSTLGDLCQASLARLVQLLGARVSRNKDMIAAMLLDVDNNDGSLESCSQKVFLNFRLTKLPMHTIKARWFTPPQVSSTEWRTFSMPCEKEPLPMDQTEEPAYYTVLQLFKIRAPRVVHWSKYQRSFATRVPVEAMRLSKQILSASSAQQHRLADFDALLEAGSVAQSFPQTIAVGEPVCAALMSGQGVLNSTVVVHYTSSRIVDILTEATAGALDGVMVSLPSAAPTTEALAKVPVNLQCAVARQRDSSFVIGMFVSCSSTTELLFECYGPREIVVSNASQFEVALHFEMTIIPSTSKQWSNQYVVTDEASKEPVAGATVAWAGPVTGSASGDGTVDIDDEELPDGIYAIKVSSPTHNTVARKLVKFQAGSVSNAPLAVELQPKSPEESASPISSPVQHRQRRNSYQRKHTSRSIARKANSTLGKSLEIVS